MDENSKEKQDDDKTITNIKFKALAIKKDIPIDFWKKKDDADSDEPTILEVHEANEGVPVRGKCIVCYKPIYQNDADVFSCPNCSREAHYLCATIFITEHQICPVCSSKLQINKTTGKYTVVKK
nr:hypothetical protein [Candidatus Sigynarchaeota archaeon]